MADGNDRGGLLSAGGIVTIITGAFEVIAGGLIATLMTVSIPLWHPNLPFSPGFWGSFGLATVPSWIVIVGIVLAVLGIVAIVGGICAVRRKGFGLSLAGAICALLPFNILGLLAVIFVSLGRKEFGGQY
mgnify:CR=1 FL=1